MRIDHCLIIWDILLQMMLMETCKEYIMEVSLIWTHYSDKM